jgi:carbamoyl-phosphate synthase large subunit
VRSPLTPRIATKVMLGRSLDGLGIKERPDEGFFGVKAPAFPFERFPGVDVVLGPEMRSTGEVMGIHRALPVALAKALMASGIELPLAGNVFLSVRDADKAGAVDIGRGLASMGFRVYATGGTYAILAEHGVGAARLGKISEGSRPNVLDAITNGEIQLIINTPTRKGAHTDEGRIRATALTAGVPMITTLTGARAAVHAIAALRAGAWSVAALQDYFPQLARERAEAVAAR